jgi:glycopeptide antibiotics resistance protein
MWGCSVLMVVIDADPYYLIPIFSIYFIIRVILHKVKRISWSDHFLHLSLFTYGLAMISITLFPIPLYYFNEEVPEMMKAHYNFVPLDSIYDTLTQAVSVDVALKQVLGNMVLFFPLGFLVPLRWSYFMTMRRVLLLGLFTSCVIEFLQFAISVAIHYRYRSVDMDDVLLNTLGCMVGFLLLKLSVPLLVGLFSLTHPSPVTTSKADLPEYPLSGEVSPERLGESR